MNDATMSSKKIHWTKATWLFVVGIALIAMTLRTPLTVVGPVIADVRESTGISNILAGFLTTIPLLAFALFSPFTSKIARRYGIERTLFASMFILAIGIIVRINFGVYGLLIGTFFIGIAISFGNVLMPSYLKLRFPLQIGLMMGLYSVSMNISAGLASGISYPLAQTTFNWQGAFSFSLIFVILAIIMWLPQLKHHVPITSTTTKTPALPLWRSPLTWAIALMMGLQSLLFYTTAAWVPEMLVSQGMTASEAGWTFSLMMLSQLPMTFLIPMIASNMSTHRAIVFGFSACYIIGFIGLYMKWTSLAPLWMILLGLAGGASFSLVMMLFTLRTESIFASAELSGFAQATGYLLAAIGPTFFGFLYDFSGNWDIPAFSFIIAAIVLFASALYASQQKTVESTL